MALYRSNPQVRNQERNYRIVNKERLYEGCKRYRVKHKIVRKYNPEKAKICKARMDKKKRTP
jgi:hypothetical protein